MHRFLVALICAALWLIPASRSLSLDAVPIDSLPTATDWMNHLREDILPFWSMRAALGDPLGDFPTFRCNDGTTLDHSDLCVEYLQAPDWITENLDKEFVRMKSRQTYLYGVAYHLTGDSQYLKWMQAGVKHIRSYGLDRGEGGAFTYFEDGEPDELGMQRTAQDLAYAAIGLAFYYYLTRDADVLSDILNLKDYVFAHYRNEDYGLSWTVEGPDANRTELVALLDQINAYMLLLTPIIPEPERSAWRDDLEFLSTHMIRNFHDPETGMFWGAIDKPKYMRLGGHQHNDFGHSIKAYWMLYFVGRLLGKAELEEFAVRYGTKMLDWAYLRGSGTWASRVDVLDRLERNKEWWIFAELNQAAATFALDGRVEYIHFLKNTYEFWLRHMVDQVNGGVWHVVRAPTGDSDGHYLQCWDAGHIPKVHLWKNGYHSVEHVLIAYITGQGLREEPVILHFALKRGSNESVETHPYYYEGEITARVVGPLPGVEGLEKVSVTFENVH